jgi:copper chaperone CopZ
MCVSEAARSIEALDGVMFVRIDRRRQAFVVRHDPSLADETSILSCVSSTGLQII